MKRAQVRQPIEDLERAGKLLRFQDAERSGQAVTGAYGPNSLLWMCQVPAPQLVGMGAE